MNRREFMEKLEKLLRDISQRERVEALAYYNDYFDDAGEENEQEVISSLGSPEKVAATIKEELGEKAKEYNGNASGTSGEGYNKQPTGSTDWGKILLIVLLCIILSPILFPAGGAALAIIIGIPAAFFGILLAMGFGGIGLAIGGVVVTVVAIARLFVSVAAGLSLLGVGLLLIGFGTLGIVAAVWISVKVIPWLIRAIVGLFRRPFEGKGGHRA